MTIAVRTTLLLATVAVAVSACETRGPGDGNADGGDDATRAEFSRQMIFVAADATGAAVLDFTMADIGSAVRRSARGWAEAGSGWTPLYDLSWAGTALRRPWRLVPHGPIRIRVGDNNEVEAISVRDQGADLAVLETSDFVAEWAPYRTSQVVLRQASLALGGEPMAGWLIDARFGVTPQAADDSTDGLAPDGDQTAADAPAAGMPQADSASPVAPAADSALLEPITPLQAGPSAMRVLSLRGVLVGPDGEALVIAETDTGLGGWLWIDDDETALPMVSLAAVAGERESWTIQAGGGAALAGTLVVMDEEPLPLSPRIVRGTIRVDDRELDMHGVLRPTELEN